MDKSKLITKYGKKFAGAKSADSVYQGVHYAKNGSVQITNRHYALQIKDAHSFPQAITLHAKTGAPIKDEFPQNFDKVFPRSYKDLIPLRAGVELDAALRSAQIMAAAAEAHNKNYPTVKLVAENGAVKLVIEHDGLSAKAFFGNTEAVNHSKRTLNASYLLTALQVFKDADRGCSIWLNDPFHPILLTDGADIDIVIPPYRTAD